MSQKVLNPNMVGLLFRNEEEILFARQRAISVRLLPTGGRFHHVVA